MVETVRQAVEEYGLILPGQSVGVAVSGGADSVCLLLVLADLAEQLGIAGLHVLHLNHGLRGAESDADAEFVARLAASLSIPATLERPASPLESLDRNLEQAARLARLDLFRRARRAHGLDRIATAHTRDDQAETVLYRLLRGSGTAGLAGIHPATGDGRIRPLLRCSRQQVEAFLTARGQAWRTDASNADRRFVRNRIRHELLPVIEREYSPAIRDILAATATAALDEESWWADVTREQYERLCSKSLNSVLIRADEFRRLPAAVSRRVLRRVFAEVKGDMRSIDLLHVERVRELARQTDGHGRVQIPGLDIFRSFEWLRVATPRVESRFQGDYAFTVDPAFLVAAANPLNLRWTTGGLDLEVREVKAVTPAESSDSTAISGRVAYTKDDELDLDTLPPGPVELRNWHPGDEIELSGRAQQKIKQLFQQFRIPIWDRHKWPVLTCGGTIVWSRQFGVSAQVVPTDQTRRILVLRETGGEPVGRAEPGRDSGIA